LLTFTGVRKPTNLGFQSPVFFGAKPYHFLSEGVRAFAFWGMLTITYSIYPYLWRAADGQ